MSEFDSAELEILERERRLAEIVSPTLADVVKVEEPWWPEEALADMRDMRDPTKHGQRILDMVAQGGWTAAQAADRVETMPIPIPAYRETGMLGAVTAAKYQAELQDRADRGDKFAISVLTTGQPGDTNE